MKNIDTDKVKLWCHSQKVYKVIGSVSKARNVDHDNRIIKYIFSPMTLSFCHLQYHFLFSYEKKSRCILESSNVCR